jgi:hypothetical protein
VGYSHGGLASDQIKVKISKLYMAKMHDAFSFPMVPKGDKNILNFAAKKTIIHLNGNSL